MTAETRQAKIAAIPADKMDEAKSAILMLQGVQDAESRGAHLLVTYNFPDTCLATILQALNTEIDTNKITTLERWRNRLRCFTEENEKAHLLYPRHWHTYVRDIYVHYHARREMVSHDKHRQLWRRHQLKPPGQTE